MAELVTPAQLGTFLRRTLVEASADLACRVAAGWLQDATGLTDWPDPVPQRLFAWAVELAGLAYDNPTGLERATLGRLTLAWGPQAAARRETILEAAAAAYAGTTGTGAPRGEFPDPVPYPDPARARRRPVSHGWWYGP